MRLSLTLLATTLFTSLTLGQKNAIFDKLPQVEYNLCAPAFHYKQREYLGCIEVDSPGRPWCQLAKPHGKDKQIRGFCKVDSVPTASSIDKKGNSVSCNPWSNTPSGKVHGCYAENSKSKKFLCDVGNKTVQCSGLQKDTSAEHNHEIIGKKAAKKLEQGKGNESIVAAVEVSGNQTKTDSNGVPKGLIAGLASAGCVGLLAAGLFIVRKRSVSRQLKAQMNEVATLESNSSGLISGYVPTEKAPDSSGPFLVVSTYTPTLGDEIEVLPGDMVTILCEYNDGWAQGINETRGKVKGVFPKHCLEPWA